MAQLGRPAPEWQIAEWVNGEPDLTNKVVVALAFQMLCPGCATQALPQMQRVRAAFGEADVAVVGLHTVFEHHEAMTPAALKAFAHEYRYDFPVGVDEPSPEGGIPATMAAYNMQGTPTLVLIDRAGQLRRQHFGLVDDLRLGAELATLLAEPPPA